MKKVLIATLLILALCLTLFACGGGSPAETPDAPEATDAPLDPDSVGGKLAALGFNELDLLPHSQDHIEVDENGDFVLYSTASYETVAKACYDACKKAADDGEVRDYWTEEPTDFVFAEDEMAFYGYYRDGKFCDLAVSPFWTDEDGFTEYLLQWE